MSARNRHGAKVVRRIQRADRHMNQPAANWEHGICRSCRRRTYLDPDTRLCNHYFDHVVEPAPSTPDRRTRRTVVRRRFKSELRVRYGATRGALCHHIAKKEIAA